MPRFPDLGFDRLIVWTLRLLARYWFECRHCAKFLSRIVWVNAIILLTICGFLSRTLIIFSAVAFWFLPFLHDDKQTLASVNQSLSLYCNFIANVGFSLVHLRLVSSVRDPNYSFLGSSRSFIPRFWFVSWYVRSYAGSWKWPILLLSINGCFLHLLALLAISCSSVLARSRFGGSFRFLLVSGIILRSSDLV